MSQPTKLFRSPAWIADETVADYLAHCGLMAGLGNGDEAEAISFAYIYADSDVRRDIEGAATLARGDWAKFCLDMLIRRPRGISFVRTVEEIEKKMGSCLVRWRADRVTEEAVERIEIPEGARSLVRAAYGVCLDAWTMETTGAAAAWRRR